jgi:hypothetical protein
VESSPYAQQGKDRQKHSTNKPQHMFSHISPCKYCEKLNTIQRGVCLCAFGG